MKKMREIVMKKIFILILLLILPVAPMSLAFADSATLTIVSNVSGGVTFVSDGSKCVSKKTRPTDITEVGGITSMSASKASISQNDTCGYASSSKYKFRVKNSDGDDIGWVKLHSSSQQKPFHKSCDASKSGYSLKKEDKDSTCTIEKL